MTVSARNSKKVFVLGTKEILIMVCVDLSRLRRGKMHNKAEKLDMFNKYCCSLFVRRRNDPLSAHVRRSCQGQPEAEQGRGFQLVLGVVFPGHSCQVCPLGLCLPFLPPVRFG